MEPGEEDGEASQFMLDTVGVPSSAVSPQWLMEPSLLPGRRYIANPKGSVQFHHCGQWHCAQGCNLSNE